MRAAKFYSAFYFTNKGAKKNYTFILSCLLWKTFVYDDCPLIGMIGSRVKKRPYIFHKGVVKLFMGSI